ncbi:hypothetical protein ACSSS7_008349 [Eimeria intestinalis]
MFWHCSGRHSSKTSLKSFSERSDGGGGGCGDNDDAEAGEWVEDEETPALAVEEAGAAVEEAGALSA